MVTNISLTWWLIYQTQGAQKQFIFLIPDAKIASTKQCVLIYLRLYPSRRKRKCSKLRRLITTTSNYKVLIFSLHCISLYLQSKHHLKIKNTSNISPHPTLLMYLFASPLWMVSLLQLQPTGMFYPTRAPIQYHVWFRVFDSVLANKIIVQLPKSHCSMLCLNLFRCSGQQPETPLISVRFLSFYF